MNTLHKYNIINNDRYQLACVKECGNNKFPICVMSIIGNRIDWNVFLSLQVNDISIYRCDTGTYSTHTCITCESTYAVHAMQKKDKKNNYINEYLLNA